MSADDERANSPQVAIVGGGLAGLAAAVRLAEHGVRVELFEARRQLGGRATSFHDPSTGALVDHCQHVALACCTNFLDFCERTHVSRFLARHPRLHFVGPDGRRSDVRASRCLPAPLHLLPSLLRLKYLTWREKVGIVRGMRALAAANSADAADIMTIDRWLRHHGQSERAIELFWAPVIVSGLSETLDRAAVGPVRKLFVEAFMASRCAYEMYVPRIPLGEFYRHLEQWLIERGVGLKLAYPIEQVSLADAGAIRIDSANRESIESDVCILAVTWRRLNDLLSEPISAKLPQLRAIDDLQPAPITAVHFWFDREFTSLPHAVLPGRTSQWLFNRGRQQIDAETSAATVAFHYQVIISASRHVADQPRDNLIEHIIRELQSVWPAAREAKLIQARLVTDKHAVFSVCPGADSLRPAQQTGIPNLFLAGDWTQTHWPATMEGAVRSGYLAAEHVLEFLQRPASLLKPDLPRSWLVRRAIGS